ncbi:MAG: hypothetical protein KDI30_06200, partial [Pseudomonadales bacterium]|nr:hypothetical protein [Pseudomonadales bacterium]
DGSPCPKCNDVMERLESSGQINQIDEILIADERDDESPGMKLARQFQVERAPFFMVEEEGKTPVIHTVYLKFVKEVLDQHTNEQEEIKDIMDSNPDLDFL